MAVGIPLPTNYTDGDVWSASDVNDITGTINTLGGGNFAAGKNKIINGDFGVWQRGTSFSNPTDNTYTADRFTYYSNGSNTRTISQQTFTPGTAPVSGYEGTYFFRYNQATAGSGAGYNGIYHRVEDVRTFAGQAVTLSVWAKADTARTLSFAINRNYGSGGSSMEYSVVTDSNMSVTTGWTRFTYSFTMPSVSGKTIGAGSFVEIGIKFPLNVTQTCDLWGLQLEAGSTATAFQTATGTIQGELAACQRYYLRISASSSYNYAWYAQGTATSSTNAKVLAPLTVPLRVAPSVARSGDVRIGNAGVAITSIAVEQAGQSSGSISVLALSMNVASGLTANQSVYVYTNNDANAYIEMSSEL